MMKENSGILSMESHFDKNDILITDEIVSSWQNIVNTLADIIGMPSALIMRVVPPFIEVFRSSESRDNPYKAGAREHPAGLYCEKVIETRSKLLIPNALKDTEWDSNPDIEMGMISYLGFPLLWPDGEVFGTLCVLDTKENEYEKRYEKLMLQFKELIESHLRILYQNLAHRSSLDGILDSLSEGIIAHDKNRRILFFNRAAERITGYSRKEVIGQDCHDVFGTPFCGGRCSFQEDPPHFIEHIDYPLNIITKRGALRRVEMSITGMNDREGLFVGVLAAFKDITDLIGLKIQLGELKGFGDIVGRDPKMLQVYTQIRDLATTDYSAHITGETGTGKEIVAAAIHEESRRAGAPFVPMNCAALPEGMVESELFGHVKGAFTGAVRDKKGRFELAHKGTLFLDEVADLPKAMQAKLLRVIQEGTFERVGGEKTVSVDVRLVSATNRNLKREVEKGNFREDLYYRINVVPIHLPPVRERKNDIPLLVEHFLDEAQEEGRETRGLSKEALSVMMGYSWPGNVRELQSALRFAIVKSRGAIIKPQDLPPELHESKTEPHLRGPSRKLNTESVKAALSHTGGNKAKAARILGVGRATLYRFLSDFPDVS